MSSIDHRALKLVEDVVAADVDAGPAGSHRLIDDACVVHHSRFDEILAGIEQMLQQRERRLLIVDECQGIHTRPSEATRSPSTRSDGVRGPSEGLRPDRDGESPARNGGDFNEFL